MADDTLTRQEEQALARARRAVGRSSTRAGPSRGGSGARRRGGARRASSRSGGLDLARGLTLVVAVTLLLAGDPSELPAVLRPSGGDGFGVADLLPVTLTVLVGVSMAWQLAAHRRESGRWWAFRWARRLGVLIGIGLLLTWLGAGDGEALRLTGPLTRLAVGGLVTWVVVTRTAPRVQAAIGGGVLLTHWFLLGRGALGAGSPVARLEAELLGGRVALPVDPDGLTALGPTVVAILAGVWIGRWLQQRPAGPATVVAFALAGVYTLAGALALAQLLPVNAVLWTGSTVVLGAGLTLVLLALGHLLIEVLPARRLVAWVGAVGAEALPVYTLAVGLAAVVARTPLGEVWRALRRALVEPLVGPDLAAVVTAAIGTVAIARVAVALAARGRLIRA